MEELMPRVVACVPAYNAEHFIEETLQCLKNQSYPNFKVLVSDDCSTDDTASVIKSFIKGDDRFTLIEQGKNLGWMDNVNFLMEKAVKMSRYTFILPHDDQLDPNYIQKLTEELERSPSAVITFSDMKFIHHEEEMAYEVSFSALEGVTNKTDRVDLLLKRKGNWGTAYRGIMRSEAVGKIIPLRKNVFGKREFSMDWVWLIKLSLHGEFVRIPEILYTKHFRKNNLSYKLTFNDWNYLANIVTCSIALWRSPMTIAEQLSAQFTITVLIIKHIVIASGLFSIGQKMGIFKRRKS